MALGKKCEFLESGLVRSSSFGRKRVTLPEISDLDFISTTPAKKLCRHNSFSISDKSPLETLPQDILIRIVCGVDHDDLKSLFHVSGAIREATLAAKGWHFEYSTPRKTLGFRSAIEMEDLGLFDEIEAPNAPMQLKVRRSRLSRKKLADISVTLFASDSEENWPRRELFMQMDTEM